MTALQKSLILRLAATRRKGAMNGFTLVELIIVVVIIGITLVALMKLDEQGVAVLGEVPAGLPTPHFAAFSLQTYGELFTDAVAVMLISFTSGVLTAKSFARRNRYEIDPNQELIAFGAANVATGIAQGFPYGEFSTCLPGWPPAEE